MTKIEFERWETPFENADLQILSICFGDGGLEAFLPDEGEKFFIEGDPDFEKYDLIFEVFNFDDKKIYKISAKGVGGFRVIDETGFNEFWAQKKNKKIGLTTFKARNHLWSKESKWVFETDTAEGWTYIIATDDLCVEIITPHPLEIVAVRELSPN